MALEKNKLIKEIVLRFAEKNSMKLNKAKKYLDSKNATQFFDECWWLLAEGDKDWAVDNLKKICEKKKQYSKD
jgi:hypothetical protein